MSSRSPKSSHQLLGLEEFPGHCMVLYQGVLENLRANLTPEEINVGCPRLTQKPQNYLLLSKLIPIFPASVVDAGNDLIRGLAKHNVCQFINSC